MKVLEVIRVLDFKQGSAKYAGIKFATPPGIGIFTMVDDSCMQSIAGREIKWEDVSQQLDTNHGKNLRCYVHDRKARNSFLIHHSAQDVKYLMTEFVARNVDCIPDEYSDMLIEEGDK